MGSGQKTATHLIQIKLTIMAGLLDTIYDQKTGLVLGRDGKSWAKILAFYAVYYTFLGFLFYGFTITWYLGSNTTPVGGRPIVKNSRLDQPGAAVHPFKERMEDGAVNKFVFGTGKDGTVTEAAYCESLAAFYQAKETLNEGAEDCSAESSPKTATCKVNTAMKLTDLDLGGKSMNYAICSKFMEAKQPMFAIDVNKIVNWTPSSEGIGFQCYEYDTKSGVKLEEQDFEFVWTTTSNRIPAYYYPFAGVSSEQLVKLPIDARSNERDSESCDTDLCSANKPYNKPFVGGYVKAKEGKDFNKKEGNMFRCDVMNSKINRFEGLNKEAQADLRKLGIGFVEFGFKF